MKVTNFGPNGLPITLAGWSTGIVSLNSNVDIIGGGPQALNFVQRITSNTSNTLLNPIVNFASGANIVFGVASNTLTISGAAGGGGTVSAGSNSTRVSEEPSAGASSTLWSPFDHRHDGIGTITASSSNTMQRGTFNLRPGSGIALSLTDTDGDGEFDTTTISTTGGGGGGSGAGALVFLEAHTASASATLDFTTFISSTYDEYVIEGVNLAPATNAQAFLMRLGTGGGPTYDASANYFSAQSGFGSSSGNGDVATTSATSFKIASSVSNGAAYGQCSFSIRLMDPQSALNKDFHGSMTFHNGTEQFACAIAGVWGLTTALTAVRFFYASGNIASGIIRIYGVSKT